MRSTYPAARRNASSLSGPQEIKPPRATMRRRFRGESEFDDEPPTTVAALCPNPRLGRDAQFRGSAAVRLSGLSSLTGPGGAHRSPIRVPQSELDVLLGDAVAAWSL